MKELLVLLVTSCLVGFGSFSDHLKICDSCTCLTLPADNKTLHVNCTRTPQFEKMIDVKSNEINQVHLTLDRMNLTSLQHYIAFKLDALNITRLSIDYNQLKTIPSFVFSKFSNLLSLSIVENEIDSISQESFGGLTKLQSLNMSYNALTTFDTIYLNDLKQLDTLDLSGNDLLKFESTSSLPKMPLKYLDLDRNKLTAFPTNALKLFRNLIQLNISVNQIKSVPEDGFEMQNYLELLDFGNNRLDEIHISAFPKENKLKTLTLNHNLISATQFISRLKNLIQLNLSYNTITKLNTTSWSGNLVELLISNNGITYLDDILKGLPQLKKLDASWNQCTKIPSTLNPNLKELILDANAITTLPPRPAGNGALKYLSLSEIPHLTVLKKDTFNGIFTSNSTNTTCATLEIRHTGLQKIGKDTLSNLNICELILSWNDLTELPADTFNWNKIQKIDLQGNPWHCSCSMQWLLDKVVAKMYNTHHQELLSNLRCHTPESLAGTRLVHWFNKSEPMLCSQINLKEANYITISSSTAMIIFVIVCGVIVVALVATGFYLQRKMLRERKRRKNRRI